MPVQTLGAGGLEVAVGGQRADAGRQTWPPWVWPARTASYPSAANWSSTRRYGACATPSRRSAPGRPARRRRRAGRSRGAGRRRRRSEIRRPRDLERRRGRWSGRASRRAELASRSSRQGSCGHVGVAGAVVGQQVAQRVAQRRREVVVGAEDEDARARRAGRRAQSSTTGTESRWARLSPVSTTRSGCRSASARSHSCLRVWPGVMWMSLRCSTRSVRAAGRQHRHLDPAQRVGARLGQRRTP